ncbi:family 78 glycoside hydrolase catalytic domain [Tessaracoccus lubricantis]|uniref:family 78 glycoside hydrolase catalytic domain n=1 Tax=Tessaracoccus lubricantis TaxID=545543 RepID=UPI0031EFC0DD
MADAPRLEYGLDGGAVPIARPRLSWRSRAEEPDWQQSAAEIRLDLDGEEHLARVDGDASVFVAWPFADLTPRARGTVRVRTEGASGWSDWSQPAPLIATFLGSGEWQAHFIGLQEPSAEAQPAQLRREFEVGSGLRRATLYATAHGVYQAFVNGSAVDDQHMKPGWTPYQYRLVHETTDVTALLEEGRNALGIALAGGWYTEHYGFQGQARPFYGTQPAVAGQLLLEYADGTHDWVVTDASWRAAGDGPWLTAGLYRGERFDASRLQSAWDRPGFDDSAWRSVALADPGPVPSPRTSPSVRVTQVLPVREVLTSPSGKVLLDFGQNLVGRLRIRVVGEAGSTVILRHAEVLENGELGTRPLRVAAATDAYTLSGVGEEVWAPSFTFHGFRYAQVDGWPGDFDPEAVVAEVIGSDMRRTGWFECSDAMVNRLHENVVWSMRGNFLYLPTDCPQRDERLGWTGDIQIFGPTAAFLHDSDSFLSSWLVDLALEQEQTGGSVGFTVPDVLDSGRIPTAAWGDAATVLPWLLHERFGDRATLARQYPSMKGWTDHILGLAGERHLWEGMYQWGDWVDPDAPADDPARAKTDPDLVASAFLFLSATLTAKAAGELGFDADASRYRAAAERVRDAWLAEFVTPAGRILSDAQTAYALALEFGIATPELAAGFGRRLAELVRRDGYRISTGFVGTPLVTHALTSTGHTAAAARMLLQTECPSWLYSVTMGATTVWERWDSMLPDGSINPGEMTSFNHYALGSVADWLHRVVAGLGPAEPAYRTVRVAPVPIPGLEHAAARFDGPYGEIRVGWRREGGSVVVTATIPANSRAEVTLPGRDAFEVASGTHTWTIDDPEPGRDTAAITMDTPLSAVIDDPAAYAAVVAAFDSVDPAVGQDFRRRTRWVANQPLASTTRLVSTTVVSALETKLDELNAGRGVR